MEPSLERTRRIDHPVAMLVLVLLVIGAISGYATLQLLNRDTTNVCDQALGRIRIHMATNPPPSAMDADGWDLVTVLYDGVNTSCPDTVADPFRAGEFAIWSAPALQFGGVPGVATAPGATPGVAPDVTPGVDEPVGDAPTND